jgi:ubiquinone/menaquinone biosynthesis C-methylase UbiE
MPQFLANIIDNPLRRAIQPPEKTALRHGLKKGMKVLEVGPGNGRYTIAASKVLGPDGLIVTIDIQEKMIERVIKKVKQENITNVHAEVADVYKLPYEDSYFDIVYMIAVINEIPDQKSALKEFHRVLKNDGLLVFSELLMDPDYPTAKSLIKKAQSNGFKLNEKIGNMFYYTLKFNKV